MWISVVVTRKKFCYSTFKVLNTCRLRGQSTRGVKANIKRQTFRVARWPCGIQYPSTQRSALLYAVMRQAVKAAALQLGVDPAKFSLHSLRIGGACALRAAGWKSAPACLSYQVVGVSEYERAMDYLRTLSFCLEDSYSVGMHIDVIQGERGIWRG